MPWMAPTPKQRPKAGYRLGEAVPFKRIIVPPQSSLPNARMAAKVLFSEFTENLTTFERKAMNHSARGADSTRLVPIPA